MSDIAVKYCPLCDSENPPFESFCLDESCAGDLMNAPVVPRRDLVGEPPAANETGGGIESEDLDAHTSHGTRGSAVLTPEPIIVPDTEEATGHDEANIPTVRASSAKQGVLKLELVENPALRFEIRPGQSVGRSNKADVVLQGVPDLAFISRVHARFEQRRAQWYVQYIAEGNFIKVDDVEYSDDSEIALYEDSIVVLSLTSFRVRLS